MSLRTSIGRDRQPARRAAGGLPPRSPCRAPGAEPERARAAARAAPAASTTATLSTLYPVADGAAGLERASTRLCRRASRAVWDGAAIVILSDRGVDAELTRRSRRCSRPRPCTRTSSARARARCAASSSSRASRARRCTSRSCSATARRRVPVPGARGPRRAPDGCRYLDGRRARPAQGLLEDGDLDRAELPRAPRSSRPSGLGAGPGRPLLPGHRRRGSAGSSSPTCTPTVASRARDGVHGAGRAAGRDGDRRASTGSRAGGEAPRLGRRTAIVACSGPSATTARQLPAITRAVAGAAADRDRCAACSSLVPAGPPLPSATSSRPRRSCAGSPPER